MSISTANHNLQVILKSIPGTYAKDPGTGTHDPQTMKTIEISLKLLISSGDHSLVEPETEALLRDQHNEKKFRFMTSKGWISKSANKSYRMLQSRVNRKANSTNVNDSSLKERASVLGNKYLFPLF